MRLKNLGVTAAILVISQTALLFQQSKTLAEPGSNKLNNGETLNSNQFLRSSNGRYQLYLQGDGNLVATSINTSTVYWSSGTGGTNANKLVMQGDNHLVLYRDNTPVWSARNTWGGEPGSFLKIENDGKLVVYKPTAVWSSNSGPIPPNPNPDPQCLYYDGIKPIPTPCTQ
jgi:hypothetical protein